METKQFEIVLDEREMQVVLQIIGQQPTSNNVWPLMVKIQQQLEQQVTPAPVAEAQEAS